MACHRQDIPAFAHNWWWQALNSLAYPASHAQKGCYVVSCKGGRGGAWGSVGGWAGLREGQGAGLYRTAEITNRAQDRFSPLISALAKNTCKDKSELSGRGWVWRWGRDFLPVGCGGSGGIASPEKNKWRQKNKNGHQASPRRVFACLKNKRKIVWTPSEETRWGR